LPANVVKTPKDEAMWKQAKKYASKSRNQKDSLYWGLVMNIFQAMKKKYKDDLPEKYPQKISASISRLNFILEYANANIQRRNQG
jgi:hypothetical protein